MLSVDMLPAQHGDCLWIEYGDGRETHRVLVDCGLKATYRSLSERLRDRPEVAFELLVLTHIDADHILGGVSLLQEFGPERFADVWFNGWKQLPADDALGALHGEVFSALLETRGFSWNGPWNKRAVVVPEEGPLPRGTLPGGLELTLLSPTLQRLVDLRRHWKAEIQREKLDLEPGLTEDALRVLAKTPRLQPDALGRKIDVERLAETVYVPDEGPPNGSSIALLAEYGGKALLLAADAFAPLLETTVRRLLRERGQNRLRLDAFKLSHHGSRGNTSPGLLDLVSCEDFLVSTNGSHFHHPHPETIARILTSRRKSRLHFNYRSDENEIWNDEDLQADFSYEAHYPKKGTQGYRLEL